ncbi:MAG: glycosyltransferase, partial [Candidatus Rokuibacteriota bacterium]
AGRRGHGARAAAARGGGSPVRRDRRLRVVHVLGRLDRGGVETWLLNVMRHIDRSRIEMHFVVHDEQAGAHDDEIRALGGRIMPCLRPSEPWRYTPALRRILRAREPYDIVHSHVHHFSGYVLGVARSAGVAARIAHSHVDTSMEETEAGVPRRLYLAAMRRSIHTHATAGFAASRGAAVALFGPAWRADPRWRTLYYGIDPVAFAGDVDRARVRRGLGLPDRAIVVGHVGRFMRQKNHEFLLRVVAEAARSEPRLRLLLVGEGPLRPAMEGEAERVGLAGKAFFAGSRSDVPTVMRGGMDVFLFPSLWEGLAVALLEAQAAGLPCVVSDTMAEEADAAPGLMRRLSLSAPPADWARAIVEAGRRADVNRETAWARMSGGRFDIRTSARALESAYLRLVGAETSRGAPDGREVSNR